MARAKSASKDSTATIGFEAKLWSAADKLRNNMDAAEYKHVVLGLLLHRGHFTVEALSLFAFSPSVELRRLCTANDEFEDPPEEFLGSSRSPAEIGSATEMALRQMDESHACASWMVLAVAQSVPLNRAEQLNCPWWEPDWLANLTQRLRFA